MPLTPIGPKVPRSAAPILGTPEGNKESNTKTESSAGARKEQMTKRTPPVKAAPSSQAAREAAHDERTELVKGVVAKAAALLDTRTARLKMLRLEKEAEKKTAAKRATNNNKPKK